MVSLPRKALIAVTSAHPPFYPDGSRTGLFYSEGLHSFDELAAAGFEIDIASETGTCKYDDHSVQSHWLSRDEETCLRTPHHPFNEKIDRQLFKAGDLAAHEYGLFFAAGGHGAMYDFPHAKHLQALAEDIYDRGGVVGAVCAGTSIMPGIHDANDEPIIQDRTITGFGVKGEVDMKVIDQMRRDNIPTIEELVEPVGATFVPPPTPYEDFNKVDGRVVTGANPASARDCARNAIKVFEGILEGI